jgi:hypothetical protein
MNIPVYHFTSISALRRHPKFDAAKGGDIAAAREVIRTFVQAKHIHLSDVVLVPAIAVEASGINMLPLILAQHIGKVAKLRVETEVVQVNRTHHTDGSAIHRLLSRPTFEGDVTPGMSYIVIEHCDCTLNAKADTSKVSSYLRDRST